MPSAKTTRAEGKISRPVSPKTIPSRGRSADITRKVTPPKICTRLSATMPSTKTATTSPGLLQPLSPTTNNYMLAVQNLDPRPLEQLHNERSYLLHNLQKQGDRATRLFHRYAAVEARLAASQSSAESKKCKREAALVRTKIAESTQQEQLILLRLGEIHVELQNRDRWMLVHHQPLVQPPPLVYPPPAPAGQPPQMHLQPALPVSLAEVCCSMDASLYSPLSPCLLSPCQEHEYEHDYGQQYDYGYAKDTLSPAPAPASALATAMTSADPSSPSDYFSCSNSNSYSYSHRDSVLSPLSPTFTPGAVFFSEDIWSRAASKSSSSAQGQDSRVSGASGGSSSGQMTTSMTTMAMTERDGERDGDGDGCGVRSGECGGGDGGGGLDSGDAVEAGADRPREESEDWSRYAEGPVNCEAAQRERGRETVLGEGENGARDSNSPSPGWNAQPSDDAEDDAREDEQEEDEDSQAWKSKLRRVSLYFPLSGSTRTKKDKRMSLPYFKGMWSRSRRGSLQETAG